MYEPIDFEATQIWSGPLQNLLGPKNTEKRTKYFMRKFKIAFGKYCVFENKKVG